jgi:hypothetical protein
VEESSRTALRAARGLRSGRDINLGNLHPTATTRAKFRFEHPLWAHTSLENHVMISIVFIGVVTALAVFAILARMSAVKPKKAEKWEKAEIIKQLLALSDGEDSISASASPPAKSLHPASSSPTRGDTVRRGTSRKHKSKGRHSPTSPKPANSPTPNRTDVEIEEKIRQRAYELYQERGRVGGNPTDDWLQAKREVLRHKARSGTTSS